MGIYFFLLGVKFPHIDLSLDIVEGTPRKADVAPPGQGAV